MREDILRIYHEFTNEMEVWEVKAYEAVRDGRELKDFQEAFNAIIHKYCKPKKTPYEREHKISVGFPSAYSTAHEVVDVEINNKKALVTVQEVTGFHNRVRFILEFYKGEWKFTKKEWFVPSEDKWAKAIL